MPLATHSPATTLMFRPTRPSPATRPATVLWAEVVVCPLDAAGPVSNCFPQVLQYRVPGLNGFPQLSQYMVPPPSSHYDQYYAPHRKKFHSSNPKNPYPSQAFAPRTPPLIPFQFAHFGHAIFELEAERRSHSKSARLSDWSRTCLNQFSQSG